MIGSGAAGLVWWRARVSSLCDSPAAERLHEVQRTQAVENALREGTTARIVTTLREAGVEPILVKGWAIARLYPELGLRPSGDVDLIIRPDQEETAYAAVNDWESGRRTFDLQYQDYPKLRDRVLADLYRRSALVPLEGSEVRVLSPEDHLALICIHFLRHDCFRPLWLCDIALCVESAGPDFDWDVCLGSDPLVRNWLGCAIGLAHEVLGADVADVPHSSLPRLPDWLVPAVLKAWRRPYGGQHPLTHEPLRQVLRHPLDLPNALRDRWWGPIRTSLWASRPFDESSRLPLQLRGFTSQIAAFGARAFSPDESFHDFG